MSTRLFLIHDRCHPRWLVLLLLPSPLLLALPMHHVWGWIGVEALLHVIQFWLWAEAATYVWFTYLISTPQEKRLRQEALRPYNRRIILMRCLLPLVWIGEMLLAVWVAFEGCSFDPPFYTLGLHLIIVFGVQILSLSDDNCWSWNHLGLLRWEKGYDPQKPHAPSRLDYLPPLSGPGESQPHRPFRRPSPSDSDSSRSWQMDNAPYEGQAREEDRYHNWACRHDDPQDCNDDACY